MKITSIDVFLVTIGQPSVPDNPWSPVVVRINTEDGISGYGEVGLAYGDVKESMVGMCRDFVKLIISMDAMNNEAAWARLHNTFWGLGGSPVVYDVMSTIDIALQGIKSKALSTPVCSLLGDKTNQKLRTYTNQIQSDWGKMAKPLTYPEEYGEARIKTKENGYDYVRVDPLCFSMQGKYKDWPCSGILQQNRLKVAHERAKAVHDASGPDMDIIIKLRSFTDTNSAVRLARAIKESGTYYYKEPAIPMSVGNMKGIAQCISIPVVNGKCIYTRWDCRLSFEECVLHVIQSDLGNIGGLTKGKRMYDMARVYDVSVQVHVYGDPQATATILQLEAVTPSFLIHGHHQAVLLETNILTGTHDYQPVSGYFTVPDLSDLGQEPNQRTMSTTVEITVK